MMHLMYVYTSDTTTTINPVNFLTLLKVFLWPFIIQAALTYPNIPQETTVLSL